MMAEGVEAEIRQEFQLPTGQGVPDIWQEIFGYVTAPADFQNLLLASPDYFEPLLEDRKPAVLFPLVLQVLDRRDHIVKSTTLECRLVSKMTRSSIDKWILDGNPCVENLNGWDHDIWDPTHDLLHCWSSFRRRNDVGNMISLLCGYASFDLYAGIPVHAELLQKFQRALVDCGSGIRYFRLSVLGPVVPSLEWLRLFLELMPNLRALDISDYVLMDDNKSQVFNPSTLPDLSHLSTLRIERLANTDFANPLLTKYGPQLKRVCLASLSRVQFTGLQFAFENLRHLSLPWIEDVDEIAEYLNPTRDWLQNLESLSLHISARSIEPVLMDVFAALENCFRTSSKLRNLNLYLSDNAFDKYNGTALPLQLCLPSLKRLWIRSGRYRLLSIDFILGMRDNLEEFTLDMRFNCPTHVNQDSQFTRLVERMHDSNLWVEMSKLERMTIRWGTVWRNPAEEVHSYNGRKKSQILAKRKD